MRPVRRARDPEVHQLDVPGERHEHVRWTDVAMNDVQRRSIAVARVMGVIERPRDLVADVRAHADGNAIAVANRTREHASDMVPGDVLHDDEVPVGVLTELVHGDDAGMRQVRSDPRFVDEHGQPLRVVGELGEETLDDDEPCHAGDLLADQKDLTHATDGEPSDHLVTAAGWSGRGDTRF